MSMDYTTGIFDLENKEIIHLYELVEICIVQGRQMSNIHKSRRKLKPKLLAVLIHLESVSALYWRTGPQ